ncbi:MAG: T9SS type A sorting domain-containing protein [Vicingus serpentipes]|nr:T9SS type A sorting domain-containing protein [Vicingus serpentipes]
MKLITTFLKLSPILLNTTLVLVFCVLSTTNLVAQTTLYSETFGTDDITNDCPSWSTQYSTAHTGDYFEVVGGMMEATDLDGSGEAVWYSQVVNTSAEATLTFSGDFYECGTMEVADYIRAYYVIDGGAEVLFFDQTDDNGVNCVLQAGSAAAIAAGTTAQIVVRISNGASEIHKFDNVSITGNVSGSLYSETFGTANLTSDCPSWSSEWYDTGEWFKVTSGAMEARNLDVEAIWYSEVVTITGYSTSISADFDYPDGSVLGGDYIKAYYILDGGAETLWFDGTGDTWATGTQNSATLAGCLTGSTLQIVIRVYNSWVRRYTFDNVLIQGFTVPVPGAATDYTFTSPSVALSAPLGNCLSDYTFTQTLPSDQANINSGETVTVNFIAGTDATTMTGGTFNGTAINMGTVTTTATSVTFTTPTGAGECSSLLSFVLNDITNPTWGSSGNATVGVDNITTGRDTGTYAYEIAVNDHDFVDYDGTTAGNYATQNGLGNCHNGLSAGVNCFRFTNQHSGSMQLLLISDCGGTGNTSSITISGGSTTVSQGGGIASLGTYDGCSTISSGLSIGTAYPAGVLTYCVTVTPACAAAGASFCPEFDCSAGDCGSASLPIELLYFNAVRDGEVVKLNWTTTAEINNNYFTIERSLNGSLFEEVSIIPGAGNSNTLINYHDVDKNPLVGTSYYRLKQTDFDGQYAYSKIVAVQPAPDSPLKLNYIYVNPTNNNLQYQFSYDQNKPLSVDLLDITGKIIYSEEVSAEENGQVVSLGTRNINKGIYLLRISDGVYSEVKKFVY